MRCEASLSKVYVRMNCEGRETQCRRVAKYRVGSSHLCPEHAATECLQIAKSAGTVETLAVSKNEKEYRSEVNCTGRHARVV